MQKGGGGMKMEPGKRNKTDTLEQNAEGERGEKEENDCVHANNGISRVSF